MEEGKSTNAVASESRRPKTWMIDFAHVLYGNDNVDVNFLEGLDSVIEAWNSILQKSRVTKDCK